jgi:hypothetical protein
MASRRYKLPLLAPNVFVARTTTLPLLPCDSTSVCVQMLIVVRAGTLFSLIKVIKKWKIGPAPRSQVSFLSADYFRTNKRQHMLFET